MLVKSDIAKILSSLAHQRLTFLKERFGLLAVSVTLMHLQVVTLVLVERDLGLALTS